MGKSSASCFRIISCGSDSVDNDDLQTTESKGSSDRRGWSFRKKSARPRVLSNSVISEIPAFTSKENPESTAVNFQVEPDLSVPDKGPVVQSTEEKTELSAYIDFKLPDTEASREEDNKADATFDEHSIIVIQAAIRGLLAQQLLLKQKSIIKLQAVVRGHIVRRHAVGSLRCVQAIIKMQALVRARRAHLLEGSADLANQRESGTQREKEAQSSVTYTYVSIEKLLSNAFARQLMEATPRNKPINIKCDPLKSDSAWKWLERWMSVSSMSNEEASNEEVSNKNRQESGASVEQHSKNLEHSVCEGGDSSVQKLPRSTDFESGGDASAEASKDENLTSCDTNDLNNHSVNPTSPPSSALELHDNDQSNTRCDVAEINTTEMKKIDLVEVVEVTNLPEKEQTGNDQDASDSNMSSTEQSETGNDQDVPDLKMSSTEQPEKEVKKMSRKVSNPAFIAAQSKFEEMSSAATSAKLTTSSSHDPVVESLDKVSDITDQPFASKDIELADNAISHASAPQRADSECGTELSISTTLDSQDTSEAAVNGNEGEIKASDETNHPSRTMENLELEAKSIILETDPSCPNSIKSERCESINSVTGESLNSVVPSYTANLQKNPETDTSQLVKKSSPEGSPSSHEIVPESQSTLSSQVSAKPKKTKGEKSGSEHKNKPSSADKNLSNRNQDSASRSSAEQLLEHKTGKRRNSFGSAKPDLKEHEPRDSSSSNSLPSYMQATESARAKAIANGSPRSSPDVHDRDLYIKKRHSLPGVNERQGSPRIHRSLSQAHQNAKGSSTNSPQDRKWRR